MLASHSGFAYHPYRFAEKRWRAKVRHATVPCQRMPWNVTIASEWLSATSCPRYNAVTCQLQK
jgi:hypothetical protein